MPLPVANNGHSGSISLHAHSVACLLSSQSLQSAGGLALPTKDVRIIKFLSPCQSIDFNHESTVSPRPQQKRNNGSASALNRPASIH